MTKSLPPQSPLHYLVVLNAPEQLAPAEIQEYREIAWKSVPESEKSHLTTKKDEAQVAVFESKGIRLLGTPDGQAKKLEEIQAANGKLVEVTYHTDQDALLGPLKLVFDPESKAFLGFSSGSKRLIQSIGITARDDPALRGSSLCCLFQSRTERLECGIMFTITSNGG